MGARASAGGFCVFQSQHSREQGNWLFFVPRAGESDAAYVSGVELADAVVYRLPSESAGEPETTGPNLQYGLEGAGQPGGTREETCGGIQNSEHGAAHKLLDVPSIADGMDERAHKEFMDDHHENEAHAHEDEQLEDLTLREHSLDLTASLGATDAMTQASILNLYDPDRARTPTYVGDIRTWAAFLDAAQAMAAEIKAAGGAGFRILTGTITSPLVSEQIQALLKLYPQAKWHQWEPAGSDGAREGSRLAFGRYVNTVYRPARAEMNLSLDSEFLASRPGHIRYMKEFYRRRKLDQFALADRAGSEMNRLYVGGPTPSVTGASEIGRASCRGRVEIS